MLVLLLRRRPVDSGNLAPTIISARRNVYDNRTSRLIAQFASLTVAPDDETVVLRSEQDEIMIDGLKLTMSGEGLIEMLNTRIRVHHTRARDNARLLKDHAETVPESVLEREIDESTDRIEALTLIRDHIVADEVYLLGEFDLRFADLLPDENWFDYQTDEPSTAAGRPGPARANDAHLVGTKS